MIDLLSSLNQGKAEVKPNGIQALSTKPTLQVTPKSKPEAKPEGKTEIQPLQARPIATIKHIPAKPQPSPTPNLSLQIRSVSAEGGEKEGAEQIQGEGRKVEQVDGKAEGSNSSEQDRLMLSNMDYLSDMIERLLEEVDTLNHDLKEQRMEIAELKKGEPHA